MERIDAMFLFVVSVQCLVVGLDCSLEDCARLGRDHASCNSVIALVGTHDH